MARKLKIMVSSTVYGFETDLEQIYATLRGWDYEVLMSHQGALHVPPGAGNEEACLEAVEECDVFLGIIRQKYGSGITHEEIKHAINLDKPRWFISQAFVPFARDILRQYMYKKNGEPRASFKFKKTDVMDNIKVIDMYNDAIQNNVPRGERKSHWAQPFYRFSDILTFLEYQFSDPKRIIERLEQLNNQNL